MPAIRAGQEGPARVDMPWIEERGYPLSEDKRPGTRPGFTGLLAAGGGPEVLEGGGVRRDFLGLAGGRGFAARQGHHLAAGRHLLHQPIPRRVVGVLDGGPVVILHLHQAVQVVVGVLGGIGKHRGGQKKINNNYP